MPPDDLERYAREARGLVRFIQANVDPTSELQFRTARADILLQTRITGLFRRSGLVLQVREHFNWNRELGHVDKDYRYEFLYKSQDLLRLENHGGRAVDHAHFPPHFISKNGQHFEIDRWPEELQSIDISKVFRYFGVIERNGYDLPEPFKSARPISRFGPTQ